MATMFKSLFAPKKPKPHQIRKYVHLDPRRSEKTLGARITAAADRAVFSWKIRERLYRHLSAQVGNGVPVETALDTFRLRLKRIKAVTADKIVADVSRRMRDGATLAGALTAWIPQDEVAVISSGELSGNLSSSLDLLIEAKRRIARVNAAIKAASITPAIYTIAVYGMLWAIGRFVTPGLQQALPKEKSQGMIYGLYVAGDFANTYWAILPPIFLGIAVWLVIRSLSRWTGAARVKAERFFPYSFYRDIQGYTWLMSFIALLRAGMPDVEILKLQLKNASPWLKERVNALWRRMDNGESLHAAMVMRGKNGMPAFGFPNPDIVDDIGSLSGFADFSDRISKLATQWADELESKTLAATKTFGFAMEIFMFAVMGLLMVAINEMSTQVGSVPGM